MVLLPENWEEKVSSTHKKSYYYNTMTKKRQWNVPSLEVEKNKMEIINFYSQVGTVKVQMKNFRLFLQSLRALLINFFGHHIRNVLDIGCGTGNDVKKWNCTYSGLDNNEKMLEIMKGRYPEVDSILADMTDDNTWMNFRKKFHAVSCFDSLQYASSDRESLRSAVRGFRRVLEDDGFLFLLVFDEDYPNKNVFEYCKTLGEKYLRKMNDREIVEWSLPLNVLQFELENADFKIEINANLSSLACYMGVQTPLESPIQLKKLQDIQSIMSNCKVIDGECWHFASSYRFLLCKPKMNKNTIPEIFDFLRSPWGMDITLR